MNKVYEICEKVEKKLRDENIWAEVVPYRASIPVFDVCINWGDWKHDHARAKWLIEHMGGYSYISSVVTAENGSDCYSAVHRFYIKNFYEEVV